MAEEVKLKPDYIFEVSWEVCNKVGGIYTVLATKAETLEKEFDDRHILIGPDIWKGKVDNPDFTEDKNLLKLWRDHAISEGLKVKIGRWNIPGKPIAVLIDFTPFYDKKNEIFTDLWIKFQLDSLTGGWDYIEPALFGYAAGKVIDCFYRYHLNSTDNIIAQFHEWMTGAGILFLKANAPQIATVFTTHATVIGRSIAGNGLPFYSHFDSYDPDQVAKDFNVIAKYSLEKVSANNADCFTTVSEITTRECKKFLGKEPDVITPNGFNDTMVPDAASFDKKRKESRKKLLDVAQGLFNQKFSDDSILVIKSGRYEFKNKGLDVFVDSLAYINKGDTANRNVLAFIFVPTHQTGPRRELIDRINHPDFEHPVSGEILTHYLQGAENDPILNQIKKNNLDTNPADKVKVAYAPVYLDGTDGIFNSYYYDLLIAFDIAIFPSYYEPWGYTPLESLAFHIPSVTTNISGFGRAINTLFNHTRKGIYVIDRNDDNYNDVVENIAGFVSNFSKKNSNEVKEIREDAYEVSQTFLWGNLILHYYEAYDIALQKSSKRESLFRFKPQAEPLVAVEIVSKSQPTWRNISIQLRLPKSLLALLKLSRNLWWSWNAEARELFEYIDTDLWSRCSQNPVVFLRSLEAIKIRKLERDKSFIEKLGAVEKRFDQYISEKTNSQPLVAYFSMEYGLNSYIKIYSGGLGILAGDYMKETSDNNMNMVGVGLLYKNGYFKQSLSLHGEQLALSDPLDPNDLPLQLVTNKNGESILVTLNNFPGRTVYARAWRLDVGRIPLYLLDANVPENNDEDKNITSQLYAGDQKTRLQQEFLLGVGGIRLLKALSITPDVYHCNEGHAAFIGIERIYNLIQNEKLDFDQALEIVRSSTLFTTHTAVPAANDMFSEDLLRTYMAHRAQSFNISWDKFMGLGRMDENNHEEKFSMTYLAAHLSGEINAVSKIHQTVSRNLLNNLWTNFRPEELPIGYVTNGVHYATWTASELQRFYKDFSGSDFEEHISNSAKWEKINDAPDSSLWEIKKTLKKKLLDALTKKLNSDLTSRHENPKKILQIINNLNEQALLIGFARRFVTYKRSDLIFYDLKRLHDIISKDSQPVQFLFAGKAHPQDTISFELIKQVISLSEQEGFEGKIIFLEDYDMNLAKLLVQGVDVWLNTPYRLMEASGTSGMKATLNGVLNLSVMDGWWVEGYREDAGWALRADTTYVNQNFQNELDAETIYRILENEIMPQYFTRNNDGVPVEWVKRMKSAITNIAPEFIMTRVLDDYKNKYYRKLYERSQKLKDNNYSLMKELVAWKKKMILNWKEIEVVSIEIKNGNAQQFKLGEEFYARIVLEKDDLSLVDIGVEILFIDKNANSKKNEIVLAKELTLTSSNDHKATFECKVSLVQSGSYEYSFRIFPKHPLLSYRTDFNLVKWV